MAELLQALLQRQRRRNPYADLMGPDPMDSQAYMDSAQGADVSMPAPVGGQPQMDDSGGGGIVSLAGGSGGSRNPFRTAEAREDDAPMEATVAGRGQRRPKECPGGVCRPRSTVVQGFSSSPRIISDGGYVVSSSPTIVSSAPMASTIVSGPSYSSGGATLGDVQGLWSAAQQAQAMGQPAARALHERGAALSMAMDANADRSRVIDNNIANDKRSYEIHQRQTAMEEAELPGKIAAAAAEIALTNAQTQYAREVTAQGNYEDRKAAVTQMLERGGNPEDLAKYLARLDSMSNVLALDPNSKPDMRNAGASPVTPQALSEARTQAYSAVAMHGIFTSAAAQKAARGLQEFNATGLVPRTEGETDDQYTARAHARLAEISGQALPRAADTIISGLQRTEEWKNNDRLGVERYLTAHVYYPMQQQMRDMFLTQRRSQLQGLTGDALDQATMTVLAEADNLTNTYAEFVEAKVQDAMVDPDYNDNKGWLSNVWGQYYGGDKAPAADKPADTNDTLPDVPAIPAGARDTAF